MCPIKMIVNKIPPFWVACKQFFVEIKKLTTKTTNQTQQNIFGQILLCRTIAFIF